ncbi:MAG: YegP family protein [Sphingomonadaceae bacterium]
MSYKFVITRDRAGEYRVNFKYNAETIFWTEGYSSKANAHNAIDSIKQNGPNAPVADES